MTSSKDGLGQLDSEVFAAYLDRTRWFGGKGRPYAVTDVRTLGELQGGPPLAKIHLVEVTYSDPSASSGEPETELYQVPLVYYPDPEHRLDHAFVGWWEDPEHGWLHAYDAVHDRQAMALWRNAFDAASSGDLHVEHLRFVSSGSGRIDPESHSTLFSGEQSNSSVAFGEDALMKVFRKVTPGINPDIAVHQVLTAAGSTRVAHLYGWLEAEADGEPLQLAMLQQFLRTASDGWELALASVRSLFAEPEQHAHESGGDFAGESTRLGEALREVHQALHEHFPAETRPASAAAELAAAMTGRLEAALAVVPELGEHASSLRATFAAVSKLDGIGVQQVHGDLHLGQTLRTSLGWKLVDFEGEPAKPLAERQQPDSPWRDVAGMLRSFDYATRVVQRSLDTGEGDADLIDRQAQEWSERNKFHFLTAYADGALTDPEQVLLNAYVADKAVYETVYETRNRPSWVAIPLQAVARIGAA